MRWIQIFENKFEKIIDDYNLTYLQISDESVALLERKYALVMTVHFDNLYVEYIMRNDNNTLISYNVSSYIVSKFDEEDRKDIVEPQNVIERLTAIFTIWSRGLPRHWENILRGDEWWLNDYKNFELAGEGKKVNLIIEKKLSNYF